MNPEIQAIQQELDMHVKIISALQDRLDEMNEHIRRSGARTEALTWALRSAIQASPHRAEIAEAVERFAAGVSIHRHVLLNDDVKDMFKETKEQLDWLMAPPSPLE